SIFSQTLEAIKNLDYPGEKLEIVVVDDSTQGDLVRETKILCENLQIRYMHRDNRKGFKAGAINSVLEEVKGEFLLILDADQIPFPHIVKDLIPYFIDTRVAFVQAKLSFRNMDCVTRSCAGLIHSEFYEVIEKAKDTTGLVTFAGTTGMFRKTALLEVGGFGEETLVEDFDTSVKLFAKGYRSRLANTYGSIGLTPWHFSSHVVQLWRWAQGTTSVLRKRASLILRSELSFFQKFDLLLTASVTPASVSILLLATMVSFMVLLDIPIIRMGNSVPLYLMMPTFLMLSHFISAIYAQRWGNQEGVPKHTLWEVIPFSIFTLMILPFLASAVVSGLMGKKNIFQRTEKALPGNEDVQKVVGPVTSQKVLRNSFLAFLLGLFLIVSGILAYVQNNLLFGFLISVGICCILPIPLLINDFRIHGKKKIAKAT
ncbi:MAG: glycosyltransferase family 2 protein, partial [Promethearchaeota archaeon]